MIPSSNLSLSSKTGTNGNIVQDRQSDSWTRGRRRKKRTDRNVVTDKSRISSEDKETQTDNSEVQMVEYDRHVWAAEL